MALYLLPPNKQISYYPAMGKCAGISLSQFQDLEILRGSQPPRTKYAENAYVVIVADSGDTIWRSSVCHNEQQDAELQMNGIRLCLHCSATYELYLKPRASLAQKKKASRTYTTKELKHVPARCVIPALHVGYEDAQKSMWLSSLLQNPERLAAEVRTAIGQSKNPEQTQFYCDAVSTLANNIWNRAKNVRSPISQLMLNIALHHLAKYGSRVISLMNSVVPFVDPSYVRRIAAQRRETLGFMPRLGFNPSVMKLLDRKREFVFGGDGTRIWRVPDIIPGSGEIVGPSWSADPSEWPCEPMTIYNSDPDKVQHFIEKARAGNSFAGEMYCGFLMQGRKTLPWLMFPQPKAGFSSSHFMLLVFACLRQLAAGPEVLFVGMATDAESRAQNAFKRLFSLPPIFVEKTGLKLLKPSHWACCLYIPVLSRMMLLSHFSDQSHLCRAVDRNFSNPKNILLLYPAKTTGRDITTTSSLAGIQIIRSLQRMGRLPHIRSQDVAAYVRMNVDGAARVVSTSTVDILKSFGTSFQRLAYVLEAVCLILEPFRSKTWMRGEDVVRTAMQGVTMLRIWRLAVSDFKMRLACGRTSRACGNFLSSSSYFALEELAQNAVAYVLFMCSSRLLDPSSLFFMANKTDDPVEVAFGQTRTSNRIDGANFTGAQFVYERAMVLVAEEAAAVANREGYQHLNPRKRIETNGSLKGLDVALHPPAAADVPLLEMDYSALDDLVGQSIDDGVFLGIQEALKVEAWRERWAPSPEERFGCGSNSTRGDLRDPVAEMRFHKLRNMVRERYRDGLASHISFHDYSSVHLISAFSDYENLDSKLVAECLWEHRQELCSVHATEHGPPELDELDADDADEGSPEPGPREQDDESEQGMALRDCVEDAAYVRSFVRDVQFCNFGKKTLLTFKEWKRFIALCGTFREHVSKDRKMRFAQGVQSGNSTIVDSAFAESVHAHKGPADSPFIHINDLCIFTTREADKKMFFGMISTIHEGTNDVRAVSAGNPNVFMTVVEYVVDIDSLEMAICPDTCVVNVFSATSHVVTVLREGIHFVEDKDHLHLTRDGLRLVPERVLSQLRSEQDPMQLSYSLEETAADQTPSTDSMTPVLLSRWKETQESEASAEETNATPVVPGTAAAAGDADSSAGTILQEVAADVALHLSRAEPESVTPIRVLKSIVSNNYRIRYVVRMSDGSVETLDPANVDPSLIAAFRHAGGGRSLRKRERISGTKNAMFDYESDSDTEEGIPHKRRAHARQRPRESDQL